MSSHRSRQRAKARALEQQHAAQMHLQRATGTSSRPADVLNYLGVEAARWTPNRGQMNFAPLDPGAVLTGGNRKTVLRKSRWLCYNDGYARFLVNGLANLIGYYTLQPATKDKAWNKIADRHWKNRIKSPAVFDAARKLNHARWQIALSRAALRDGDVLTALSYAQSGAGQVLLYGSHQIDSGSREEKAGFHDGVYYDQFRAHTGYNLVSKFDGSEKGTTIRASDAIYYGDFQDSAEVRPMPRLTHAINDLHDIIEIDLDSKLGIKRRQFVGIYRKRQKANSQPFGLGVYQAPHVEEGSNVTSTNADGTTAAQQNLVSVEAVTERTGLGSLEEGEDFGVVESDQPGPNEREFNKSLLSKISLGIGLPPSVTFSILGAGGPEVRFHMAQLQRWIQIELLNLLTAVQAHYFWVMGTDMARGALPFPDDPEWWTHIAIPCSDLTIDRGRELSGKIAALKVGALTHADLYAEAGNDWEERIELQAEIIAHAAAVAAQKGLTGGLADLMPDWSTKAAPATAAMP
jgi:hypothetical protein